MTLKNTEKYDITVYNNQTINFEADIIEEHALGNFYCKDDKSYIIYKTSQDGVENSSMIIVSDKCVKIKKDGIIKSNMLYIQGNKTRFSYLTPYGTMNVEAETKLIENSLTEFGGELHIVYDLFIQNEKYSNDLKIHIIKRLM